MNGSLSLAQFLSLPSRFVSWWLGELRACLPDAWRGRRGGLVVTLIGQELSFQRAQGGQLEELGRCGLAAESDLPVALRRALRRAKVRDTRLVLPEGRVLRRRISLPLAAAENLREVVSFEMDRHTPFAARDVAFDFRVAGRDGELDRLHLELFLLPHRTLDPILARLSGLGLNVTACGLAEEPAINLLGAAPKTGGGPWMRRLTWATAGLCCLALAAAVLLPLEARKAELAQLEDRLAAARKAAFAADDLKSQVARRLDKSLFLVEKKRQTLAVIALLDEVTHRLPDDAWLIQFALRGNRLNLAGYADKPTELIGLLEDSEEIGAVAFISPVVVDPRVQRERFNLQAQVGREKAQ